MNVAPLTASTSAVCRFRISCCRTGAADEEISSERGSGPWSWSASSLTILPFWTVTWTCALPYRVAMASPVAVPEPPDEPPEEPVRAEAARD